MMKRIGLAALAALALMGGAADAAILTFAASGRFENRQALGGTVSIDTALGRVTAARLTVDGTPAFTGDIITYNRVYDPYAGYLLIVTADGTLDNYVTLLLDRSLVGYAGGRLFATDRPSATDYTSGYITGADGYALDTGRLSLPAVPEPASWALLAAGFAGVGAALRRRRAAVAARA